MHECPKCGGELEIIEAEPDVGITGCMYCSKCDEGFDLEDDQYDYRED